MFIYHRMFGKKHSLKKWFCLFLLTCWFFGFASRLNAQAIPVRDKKHNKWSKILENVRHVNETILIVQDINEQVHFSILSIKQHRDHNRNGVDDLFYIDKRNHIKILLSIANETNSVWELFQNVLENDTQIMDDKGRLNLIEEAYQGAVKIRKSLFLQLRQINKEIYQYKTKRRQILVFGKLFSSN